MALHDFVFQKLDSFGKFLFGDPQSPTFETRKTFFEILFGAVGFIALKNIFESVLDIEL